METLKELERPRYHRIVGVGPQGGWICGDPECLACIVLGYKQLPALGQATQALKQEQKAHDRAWAEYSTSGNECARLRRALEQEREKVRIKDEALDFIAVVNDALPARKYAERTIELMRRRAREALTSTSAVQTRGATGE